MIAMRLIILAGMVLMSTAAPAMDCTVYYSAHARQACREGNRDAASWPALAGESYRRAAELEAACLCGPPPAMPTMIMIENKIVIRPQKKKGSP